MIKIENPTGCIEVSEAYFAKLIGDAASSCFGVAQMANRSAVQGIKGFFAKGVLADKGVSVRSINNCLIVDLHIIVGYGLNISAIAKSIINKVKYTVEQATGLRVKKVNVYIDGMTAE